MTAAQDAWITELIRLFRPTDRRYPSPAALTRALDPSVRRSAALDALDAALVELTNSRDYDALAAFLPPQEGKSQAVSRGYPKWLLDANQAVRIGVVSYELDLALRWGRDVKQDIALAPPGKLNISIRRDSQAAGRWETPAGGGMYCVGIGGPLTGRPIDVLIVDDPVKDRAAAESERWRDLAWEWWESVALTRLAPGGKVVLIMTRWHEDDLAGRILSRPGPLRWRVLSIPAIAGEDDPIGRTPGQELVSVRGREPGYFRRLAATMSRYVFSGMYQASPTAPEGNIFRRALFRYWRPMDAWADGRERIDLEGAPVTLDDAWRFLTIDPAASLRTEADYTVISCWALSIDGHLILLDRARARVQDHDHFAMAAPLMRRWAASQVFIERGWWSGTFVQDAISAGVPVAPLAADSDKLTRAIPAAARLASGRVWFPAQTSGCHCGGPCQETEPKGQWLDEWLDELAGFPRATHDDQVDTLSYAARVVAGEYVPPAPLPRPARPTVPDEAARAATGGTGDGHGDLNLMDVPF